MQKRRSSDMGSFVRIVKCKTVLLAMALLETELVLFTKAQVSVQLRDSSNIH